MHFAPKGPRPRIVPGSIANLWVVETACGNTYMISPLTTGLGAPAETTISSADPAKVLCPRCLGSAAFAAAEASAPHPASK